MITFTHTFLLLRPRGHDDDIALTRLGMSPGSDVRGSIAVVGRIAKVLDLGIAKFLLRIDEQDLAGDRVVE